MNRSERFAARRLYLQFRAAGLSWQAAATAAGLPVGRTAAFLLERSVRQEGETALLQIILVSIEWSLIFVRCVLTSSI